MANAILYCLTLTTVIWSSIGAVQKQIQYQRANYSTSLQCDIRKYRQATTTTAEWFRGSVLFSDDIGDAIINSTYYYSLNDSTGYLDITKFDPMLHSGPYTCAIQDTENDVLLYSCPVFLNSGEINTEFVVQPTNVTAVKSTNAVLQCRPPLSKPEPQIYWEKDGNILSNAIITSSGNLYIPSVQLSDSGYYRCIAFNSLTGIFRYSNNAYLDVTGDFNYLSWIPQFIIEPVNMTVVLGDSFQWECFAAYPMAAWKRLDSLPLTADSTSSLGILNFTSVSINDGGVYRCTCDTMLSSDVHLTVVGPPQVQLTANVLYATLGSNVTVTCSSSTPSISGKVNLTLIVDGDIIQQYTSITDYDHAVDITVVENDTRNYMLVQCLMSNQYGCSYDIINVTIIDEISTTSMASTTTMASPSSTAISSTITSFVPTPTSTLPPPPSVTITVYPKAIAITSNGSANITCVASSTTMTLNSGMLSWYPSVVTQDSQSSGSMITSIATVSSPGLYICSIFFGLPPYLVSDTVNVTLYEIPTTTMASPSSTAISSTITSFVPTPSSTLPPPPSVTITVYPKAIAITSNGSATITCIASSTTVTLNSGMLSWFPSVVTQDSQSSGSIITSIATVSSPGLYTCSIFIYTNELLPYHVSDTATVTLSVPPSPTTTSTFTPTSPTPTSTPITVTVLNSEIATTVGSYVDLTCIFSGIDVNVHWLKNVTVIRNGQLQEREGKTYATLRFGPVNESNSGLYLCVGTLQTSALVVTGYLNLTVLSPPSSAPQILNAVWTPSFGVLTLIWSPINDTDILGYKLNWGLLSDKPISLSALTSVSSTTYYYNINRLRSKSTYVIKLWAYNIGGDGPPATIQKFLPGKVSVTTVTPTSTSITTATVPLATPSPTIIPTSAVILDSCERLTPSLAKVNLKAHSFEDPISMRYMCPTSGHNGSKVISLNSGARNKLIAIHGLQTNCSYKILASIVLNSILHIANCSINGLQHSDTKHVNVSINWSSSNELRVNWSVSEQILSLGDTLTVQWKITDTTQWLPIDNKLSQSNNYQNIRSVDVRVLLDNSTIYMNSYTIDEPQSETVVSADEWLTYGVGIAVLLLVSVTAISLILILKCIQGRRREKDKVTDHRQRQQQLCFPNSKFSRRSKHEILYASIKRPNSITEQSPSPTSTAQTVISV